MCDKQRESERAEQNEPPQAQAEAIEPSQLIERRAPNWIAHRALRSAAALNATPIALPDRRANSRQISAAHRSDRTAI